MRMTLTPLQKKEVAEKFLKYLEDNGIASSPKTYDTVKAASEAIDEPIYFVWRAFKLLRIMGRVELNRPDGKKGFRVLDYTPLSVYQLKSDKYRESVETDMLAQLLKDLKKHYPKIWQNAINQI